jgi:hypothetical protein
MTSPAAALTTADFRMLVLDFVQFGKPGSLEILLDGLEEAHGLAGYERRALNLMLKHARLTWTTQVVAGKSKGKRRLKGTWAKLTVMACVRAAVARELCESMEMKVVWVEDDADRRYPLVTARTEDEVSLRCDVLDNDQEVVATAENLTTGNYKSKTERLLIENMVLLGAAEFWLDNLESEPVRFDSPNSVLLDLAK